MRFKEPDFLDTQPLDINILLESNLKVGKVINMKSLSISEFIGYATPVKCYRHAPSSFKMVIGWIVNDDETYTLLFKDEPPESISGEDVIFITNEDWRMIHNEHNR